MIVKEMRPARATWRSFSWQTTAAEDTEKLRASKATEMQGQLQMR